MIRDILLGLGFAALIEGLILALAPLRFEDLVRALSSLSHDQRRLVGLAMVAASILVIWFAHELSVTDP